MKSDSVLISDSMSPPPPIPPYLPPFTLVLHHPRRIAIVVSIDTCFC